MELQEKEAQKYKGIQEISLGRTNSQYVSINSRAKAIQIIGQTKAFYSQIIPESRCVRKKTLELDILITSKNGDRKIMQSVRITSAP